MRRLFRRCRLSSAQCAGSSARFFSREAPSFRIDGFELAAIDRHDAGVQEIEAAAKGDELLANLADVAKSFTSIACCASISIWRPRPSPASTQVHNVILKIRGLPYSSSCHVVALAQVTSAALLVRALTFLLATVRSVTKSALDFPPNPRIGVVIGWRRGGHGRRQGSPRGLRGFG